MTTQLLLYYWHDCIIKMSKGHAQKGGNKMITMTEFAILAIAATVVAPTGIVASLCLACMWGNKRSTYVEN